MMIMTKKKGKAADNKTGRDTTIVAVLSEVNSIFVSKKTQTRAAE